MYHTVWKYQAPLIDVYKFKIFVPNALRFPNRVYGTLEWDTCSSFLNKAQAETLSVRPSKAYSFVTNLNFALACGSLFGLSVVTPSQNNTSKRVVFSNSVLYVKRELKSIFTFQFAYPLFRVNLWRG